MQHLQKGVVGGQIIKDIVDDHCDSDRDSRLQ